MWNEVCWTTVHKGVGIWGFRKIGTWEAARPMKRLPNTLESLSTILRKRGGGGGDGGAGGGGERGRKEIPVSLRWFQPIKPEQGAVTCPQLCSTQAHSFSFPLSFSTPAVPSNTNKELEITSQRLPQYLYHCVFHVCVQLSLWKLFLSKCIWKYRPWSWMVRKQIEWQSIKATL